MKKLVPDPPPVLCVRPGLSPEDALRNVDEHLKGALCALNHLPRQALPRHQTLISDAILDLKICKALLTVARYRTTASVPIP
ncbi:hypothetical protein ACIP1T_24930 [Pseudomonas japonica]|uniref:hypothetical protein n=1 Tax=Pseudomonas TaxID=286 RepID=UPI002928E4AE|nr:hypothetical protein [Pseudomonas sp. zfem002]MDU9390008.1 hypothetical protein [Pseudomonas sp. zfem002]